MTQSRAIPMEEDGLETSSSALAAICNASETGRVQCGEGMAGRVSGPNGRLTDYPAPAVCDMLVALGTVWQS